eukprot:TRINITY_DN23259_c0_g1_i3.p1 TRINITY_DN23259_c0_g1~~TRINITY_DN23259_c0_g1_i3.p1  ORF type:complete len:488 (+),score=98.85 TRINITY_DN23259_c0_g1_i3:127-1590(+)
MPRRQPSVRSNRMQPQQADRNVNQRETNRQSRNLFRQSLLNEFMGIYGRQREGGHGRTAEAGRHADENTLSVSRRGQEQQDTHRQLQRSARHGYVPVEYFQRVPRYDLFHSQGGPESGGGGVVERLRGSEDDDANGDVVYDSEGNPCPYLSQVIQNHSPPPPLPHNPPLQPLSRDLQRSGSEGDELELLRSRFVRQIEDRYDEDRQRRREEQQWAQLPVSVAGNREVVEREVILEEEEQIMGEILQEQVVENYEKVPSCSYLSMGMVFRGFQTVADSLHAAVNINEWEVTVTIQACNMETGYVCGMMQANITSGSPAPGPVLTCWVGEIIDNENYNFITDKWCAERQDDNEYWARFPSYQKIQDTVRQGRSNQLAQHSHIYMRWKEQFFVQENPNNQLSILGFYYVALDRRTGSVQGWYFSRCQESGCQELRLDIVQGKDLRTVSKNCGQKKSARKISERRAEFEDNRQVKRCKGMQGQGFPAYAIY